MQMCANVLCPTPSVADEIANKAKTLKFIFHKNKIKKFGAMQSGEGSKAEVAEQALAFCRGTEADFSNPFAGSRKQHKCWEQYQALQKQVSEDNEGGPFGTPVRKLIEFFQVKLHHPGLNKLDRDRMQKCVEDFQQEMAKVTGTSGAIVEHRVVKLEDGNPSDTRYQQAEEIENKDEKKEKK